MPGDSSLPRGIAVSFKDLERWDLKSAIAAAFRNAHPDFVPLGRYAEESTEMVRPSDDPEKMWPVYGVNNRGGVFFNHFQKGSEFNAPYKRIRCDWFFHNPTRANVGSLGRVPEVEDDAITSPEYQVWRIKDPEWSPDYVEVLLQLPFFLRLIQVHRVGAVKERLYTQNLLQIPVPPHSRDFQQAIVVRWREAQKKVAEARAEADRRASEVTAAFVRDLGLIPPPAISNRKAFAVGWKDFARWSVSYNQAAARGLDLTAGSFSVAKLGTILKVVQYGTSQKANTKQEGTPVVRMNNLQDGELDLSDLKHCLLSEKAKAALLLQEDDILFNRTNSKELVGKCAIIRRDEGLVFASYLIRLRVDETKANPEFVTFVLNSPIGRQQIDALSRQIIGQANINSKEIRSMLLPIPSLIEQNELMRKVAEGKAEILKARSFATATAEEAKAEIEAMILGAVKV